MSSVSEVLDVERLRQDFPVFRGSERLIYLDSAATSLKPRQVIDALSRFYAECHGSAGRGVHEGSRRVGELLQQARRSVAFLIGADEDEIVFTANSTEALQGIASGHPAARRGPVVVTDANHHSAFLPFAENNPQRLRRARVQADGTLDLEDLEKQLDGAALLCLPHVSNALGWLSPVEEAVALARRAGVLVLLDGAQSVPHMPVDVETLDVDFFTFSGHKMLAPFGIGVLYGRARELEKVRPWRWGGGMVETVEEGRPVLRGIPTRFEGGTPNVGGAVALSAAIDFLEDIGLSAIEQHVKALSRLARSRLREISGLEVHGPLHDGGLVSAVSFSVPGMASHALARLLGDRFNIAVRSGHHCAQPFHESLQWSDAVRASFYLYNDESDIATLTEALKTLGGNLRR